MNLDAIRSGVSLPDIVAKLPRIPAASAVSGLIVAALILMTPNPWFEAFIVESGLPGVLTAAEPPLGARARIVFALIAALIVTIGAWVALSAILGRKMRGQTAQQNRYAYDEEEDQGPRIRRRVDSHPDAPYRRPIMAGEEMGVPLDLVSVAPTEASGSDDETDVLDLEEIAEIIAQEPDFTEPVQGEAEPLEDGNRSTLPEVDAADGIEQRAEPVFEIPLPRRDAVHEEVVEQPIERGDAVVSPVTSPSPSEIRSELADLVARLEAGLARKQAGAQNAQKGYADLAHENVTAHPQAQSQTLAGTDQDAALREALNALQKVAGKAS